MPVDGESWCCASTSTPVSSKAFAACVSASGPNQVNVQTTSTVASGFTSLTPVAKALMPLITSGIGNAAT